MEPMDWFKGKSTGNPWVFTMKNMVFLPETMVFTMKNRLFLYLSQWIGSREKINQGKPP